MESCEGIPPLGVGTPAASAGLWRGRRSGEQFVALAFMSCLVVARESSSARKQRNQLSMVVVGKHFTCLLIVI